MRAIDLYAGIGGWSLGLRLAGVDVVASYEWWQPAIDTHNGNHGGALQPVDIRGLQLADLPTDIDIVVGSPPCTEFSYSNRGGSGDIAEGLKDIVKFFEVVEHLKPRFWAMENVPRVAEVLEQGFRKEGHALHRFRHLDPHIEVVDFSEYGTPQARRRCIATNIPFSLIKAYKDRVPRRTLGDVIAALAAAEDVVDPVWGTILPAAKLTEMEVEPVLNSEELRMNREAKEFHPVYNNMAFPDPLDEPARTVTATCTRVSRESIVIADPVRRASFRRLTVRERACLQGFPITYQFYARSFSEKAKMVGNAIPPTFTYLLALAANGVDADAFDGFTSVADQLELPAKAAPVTAADGEGRSYPERRSFRAALPHLRFKSGMRFDLSNEFTAGGDVSWRVRFYFGSSKDIREIELDGTIERELRQSLLRDPEFGAFRAHLVRAQTEFAGTDPRTLQSVWTHRKDGPSPYDVVDLLGGLADELHHLLEKVAPSRSAVMAAYVASVAEEAGSDGEIPGLSKLQKYALRIISGFIVADWFNTLDWHAAQRTAA